MKHYILFTQEELEDMLYGCEIAHKLSNSNDETVYFMCKEHFFDDEKED